MINFIILTIVLTMLVVGGTMYVKKYNSSDLLIALFVSIVISANIIAYKVASYDLGFMTIFATTGTVLFALTYLITDIVNEYFGRKETMKMIYITFFAQICATIFILMAISMPGAPFFTDQEAFVRILGSAPRVIFASLFTFIIMESLDAYLFQKIKSLTKGRHLWVRSAVATVPIMFIESVIFVSLAFYGVFPVWPVIYGMVILKLIVIVVDVPFIYLGRHVMKHGLTFKKLNISENVVKSSL